MKSDVFFIEKNFLPEIGKTLEKIGIGKVKNKSVAIKVHMGEFGNLNYVRPPVIGKIVEIVKKFGGKPFLFETPTLYFGSRSTIEKYKDTARKNGFTEETVGCPIIISNEGVRVKTRPPLKWLEIGKEMYNADFLFVISHAKGHSEIGFGGAIKNIGIGGLTKKSKDMVHRDFQYTNKKPKKVTLQEMLPLGAYPIIKRFKNKQIYVNVLFDITAECDCEDTCSHKDFPVCNDIGILVSKNPVAIDNASIDLINKETGKNVFFELHKIEPKQVINFSVKAGLGSKEYNLKDVNPR